MNWKFTDQTNSVVYRINDDGSTESCLVSVIQSWIDQGNTPDPADPPDHNAIIQAQIKAIEDQSGASTVVREGLIGAFQFIAQQTASQMTAAGQPTTADQLLAQNPAYQQAIAIEAQVKALEGQLT